MAKGLGYGGYPNDCCQECGAVLLDVCYSVNKSSKRVPRTDKICESCFAELPVEVRRLHHHYTYRSGLVNSAQG